MRVILGGTNTTASFLRPPFSLLGKLEARNGVVPRANERGGGA